MNDVEFGARSRAVERTSPGGPLDRRRPGCRPIVRPSLPRSKASPSSRIVGVPLTPLPSASVVARRPAVVPAPAVDPGLHAGLVGAGLDRQVDQPVLARGTGPPRGAGWRRAGRGTSSPPPGRPAGAPPQNASWRAIEYGPRRLRSRTAGTRSATLPSSASAASCSLAGLLELPADRAEEVLVDHDLVRGAARRPPSGRSRCPTPGRRRRRSVVVALRVDEEAGADDQRRTRRPRRPRVRMLPAPFAALLLGSAAALAARSLLRPCGLGASCRGQVRRLRVGRSGRTGRCASGTAALSSARRVRPCQTRYAESTSRPTSRAISHGYFDVAPASSPPPPKQPQSISMPRAQTEAMPMTKATKQQPGDHRGTAGQQAEHQAGADDDLEHREQVADRVDDDAGSSS